MGRDPANPSASELSFSTGMFAHYRIVARIKEVFIPSFGNLFVFSRWSSLYVNGLLVTFGCKNPPCDRNNA